MWPAAKRGLPTSGLSTLKRAVPAASHNPDNWSCQSSAVEKIGSEWISLGRLFVHQHDVCLGSIRIIFVGSFGNASNTDGVPFLHQHFTHSGTVFARLVLIFAVCHLM